MTDIGLSLLGARETDRAADAAREEGKLSAEMETVAQLQRETDRKLALINAVSSQRAKAGASGIDINTGSPLTVVQEMIDQESRDTDRDKFNARVAEQSALYRANITSSQLRNRGRLSLLRAGVETATTLPVGK